MNMKVLVGGVAAIVVAVGSYIFVQAQSGKANSPTPTPISRPTTGVPSPSLQNESATMSGDTAQGATITISTAGFDPQTIIIKKGGRVTWVNKSGDLANVRSAIHPTHQVYPPLNLGDVLDNQSVSLAFDKTGTYNYHDHLQPNKTGTIAVE